MEPNAIDPLERSLKDVSWWSGPTPNVWKRALKTAKQDTDCARPSRLRRFMLSPWSLVGVPVAAAVVMAVVMVWDASGLSSPATVCSARLSQGVGLSAQDRELFSAARPMAMPEYVNAPVGQAKASWHSGAKAPDTDGDGIADGVRFRTGVSTSSARAASPGYSPQYAAIAVASQPAGAGESAASIGRQVIHAGLVDLLADDVRGAYLKIQTLVPNPAAGEYIERSQIYDTSGQLNGYILLRVRGERLHEVLNLLRGLADVAKEQIDATDVTAQVVDIEARLRNERRVEQELLTLLEKRKDSPLEDILKLSQSLAEVRGRIESLVGQQQQLGRQVALASIVVTIRPKDAKPVVEPDTFGRRLALQFGSAWHDGVWFLMATLAAFVRIVIGGLVWWVLLVVGLWLLRKWYLKRAAA